MLAAEDNFLRDRAESSSINIFKQFLAFKRFSDILGTLSGIWITEPLLLNLALSYNITARDGALFTLKLVRQAL